LRCSNIDQDFAKEGKEEERGKGRREKGRKEKGKSEGKYTYPPTHHMCMKDFLGNILARRC
jgi:hypothetical protein